jgi:putative SOS response-associated peptidase YedK
VGEFRPNAHQPVWFSQPKLLADSDGVAAGVQGRTEMGTYGSLTEHNGKRILWYPDRKHFLLGKEITDEWLSDMKVDGER